jgi:ferredoxin
VVIACRAWCVVLGGLKHSCEEAFDVALKGKSYIRPLNVVSPSVKNAPEGSVTTGTVLQFFDAGAFPLGTLDFHRALSDSELLELARQREVALKTEVSRGVHVGYQSLCAESCPVCAASCPPQLARVEQAVVILVKHGDARVRDLRILAERRRHRGDLKSCPVCPAPPQFDWLWHKTSQLKGASESAAWALEEPANKLAITAADSRLKGDVQLAEGLESALSSIVDTQRVLIGEAQQLGV